MSEFIVSEVVDGDIFKVKNGWKWNNKVGNNVRPTGYNIPEKWQIGYDGVKTRLTNLILNKIVDIRNAQAIDTYGRLIADVYYNDKNLADYFPEYKI